MKAKLLCWEGTLSRIFLALKMGGKVSHKIQCFYCTLFIFFEKYQKIRRWNSIFNWRTVKTMKTRWIIITEKRESLQGKCWAQVVLTLGLLLILGMNWWSGLPKERDSAIGERETAKTFCFHLWLEQQIWQLSKIKYTNICWILVYCT